MTIYLSVRSFVTHGLPETKTLLGTVRRLVSVEVHGNRIKDDVFEDLTENGCQAFWPIVIGECFLAFCEDIGHLDSPLVIRDNACVQ